MPRCENVMIPPHVVYFTTWETSRKEAAKRFGIGSHPDKTSNSQWVDKKMVFKSIRKQDGVQRMSRRLQRKSPELNQVKPPTSSWRALICKGNMVLWHFPVNFRLIVQRKQKGKTGVPARGTLCVLSTIPGKNKFIERHFNTEKYTHTHTHGGTFNPPLPVKTTNNIWEICPEWNPHGSPLGTMETLHHKCDCSAIMYDAKAAMQFPPAHWKSQENVYCFWFQLV